VSHGGWLFLCVWVWRCFGAGLFLWLVVGVVFWWRVVVANPKGIFFGTIIYVHECYVIIRLLREKRKEGSRMVKRLVAYHSCVRS